MKKNKGGGEKPAAAKGREGILKYLLANRGRVLAWRELHAASGNQTEWARRTRELRDEYGYQILTHKDRAGLKPGEYLIETDERLPVVPRSVSKETRAFVLERNGYTCQKCGLGPGDPDPLHPGRKIRLVLGHIIDKSKGGSDTPDNLRAECTNCNEGLQNTSPPKPSRIELMKQVRRATVDNQRYLYEWLKQRFVPILRKK